MANSGIIYVFERTWVIFNMYMIVKILLLQLSAKSDKKSEESDVGTEDDRW